jgi:hypothetical protein
MIDPAYYTVAHGNGQTTTSAEAGVDLDRDTGAATHRSTPFHTRLNQILDNADFDQYVESLCQRFYAEEVGRTGLPLLPLPSDRLL